MYCDRPHSTEYIVYSSRLPRQTHTPCTVWPHTHSVRLRFLHLFVQCNSNNPSSVSTSSTETPPFRQTLLVLAPLAISLNNVASVHILGPLPSSTPVHAARYTCIGPLGTRFAAPAHWRSHAPHSLQRSRPLLLSAFSPRAMTRDGALSVSLKDPSMEP